jgi:hypothetical protein
MQHIPLEIICLGIIVADDGQPRPIGKAVNSKRLSPLAVDSSPWRLASNRRRRIRRASAGNRDFCRDGALAAPLRYGKHRFPPANSPRLENP